MNITETLNYRRVFLFWGPLALTWLMMSVEQPLLISFIARLDDAKYNLAAFGIAGSFALIIEAPIIMLMSASTALVADSHSYLKMRRFADVLNGSITLLQLVILIPSVFNFIVMDIMEVPENVAGIAHIALLIFLPWAASIGYRRFYQGILIRSNLTRRVTYGTLVRLIVIAVVGVSLFFAGINGAYVGAAAMSLAVFLESIATRIMADRSVKELLQKTNPGTDPLTYRSITRFYYPLALTSVLSLGVHPFVTFFMGRSLMPVESMAVLPVVSSLVFIFRSMGLSYQEVNIALIGGKRQNYRLLRDFALYMGIGVTAGLSILAFTPLAKLWLIDVSGLSNELAGLSYLPLKIMIFLPALTVLLNYQRSTLVIAKKTGPISTATAIELVVIIVVLLICVAFLNIIGVVAASIAFVVGKGLSTLYLINKTRSVVRSWKVNS